MKSTAQKNEKNGLLSRSEQLGTANRPEIDFDLRRANRTLDTERLLLLLRTEAPRFFELAEVVGKWVWIQFSYKQPPTITRVLAECGFQWNNTRQVWQHPCGTIQRDRAAFDPRKRYRSYFAADAKPVCEPAMNTVLISPLKPQVSILPLEAIRRGCQLNCQLPPLK